MWIAIEYRYMLGQKSEFKFWCELGWFLQRQSHIVTILIGVAALKMHYNNLLMSLPEDHLITLQRFCDIGIYELRDEAVNLIVSSTDSQWSNNIMFNSLISITKNDNQLLGLSFLIERLVTGEALISDSPKIESFRNG